MSRQDLDGREVINGTIIDAVANGATHREDVAEVVVDALPVEAGTVFRAMDHLQGEGRLVGEGSTVRLPDGRRSP